jgi:tRNA threonylcarbamoyl adenosine modification protein (Sua5/YciO/YrdC/YwlC family)
MLLEVNVNHPEPRKLERAVQILREGGVIAYPTDTVYALGCDITNKKAIDRIHRMKKMRDDQLLSFVCADLSDIARYGIVQDYAYRIMRKLFPGPYTVLLSATREVPKVLRQNRKTVGIRVPDHPIALALSRELGQPVASTSASLDGEQLVDPRDMEDRFPEIELIIDAPIESGGLTPSTIIDLSGESPVLVREGAGPTDHLF